MKKALRIIVFLLIVAVSSTATAASSNDVSSFIKTLTSNKRKLLKFKKHSNGTLEAVYVINKKRYTSTFKAKGDHIFFYIRPDGTSGDTHLEMVGGEKGRVLFGAKGGSTKSLFESCIGHGKEFERYWQRVYDAAIANTLEHFQN